MQAISVAPQRWLELMKFTQQVLTLDGLIRMIMGRFFRSALSADEPMRCSHNEHVPTPPPIQQELKARTKVSTFIIVCDVVSKNIF